MSKSSRAMARAYLAKVEKEDKEKIEAFNKACFDDDVMMKIGDFSKTDFKVAGSLIKPNIESIFGKAHAASEKKKASHKASANTAKAASKKAPVFEMAANTDAEAVTNDEAASSRNGQFPFAIS